MVENRAPGSNGLVNEIRGLSNELETLRETYFGVNARLAAYHALHPRNKRSLVPFIGQAFFVSYLGQSLREIWGRLDVICTF